MFWLIFCLFVTFSLTADEIIVDLRNPSYKDGLFSTDEGGVIRGKDLRIQARHIHYYKKDGVETISASGDLLMQYGARAFVGTRIDYDIRKKEGSIENGKTFFSNFYVGGKTIELRSDGSYHIDVGTITASENKESSWDLYAKTIDVMPEDFISAKNIYFRLYQVPTFWLPAVKWNFSEGKKDPLFRYTFNWDKGQGPRAAVRYQLYSWRDFALFGRFEYRWATGVGGAIETEYFPPNSKSSMVTRSYVGTDRLQTAMNKEFRFRLQGDGKWQSEDEKTKCVLSWDKYNDVRMQNDFPTDDFEVNTAGQTILFVQHKEPFALSNFKVRPRVNSFESIKQDLPTGYFHLLPISLGNSQILSFTHVKAAYLDFAYSDQLGKNPPLFPPSDYRSARCELYQKFSRAIPIGPLTLTPYAGALATFYSNSASHKAKPVAMGLYGANLWIGGKRKYESFYHHIQPYLSFDAITAPTYAPDEHYIFSIQDGYNKINQVKVGLKNILFSSIEKGLPPLFSADLYADAFFSDHTIPQVIPRAYFWAESNLSSVFLSLRSCWNFRNHILDYTNALCRWTVNENIALSVETRYRSKFDWRKADHENFILDVTRSESDLLASPLSDRRITLLSKLYMRLNPFWELHFAAHQGFFRLNEAPYNEFKIDLITWIASGLKLHLSYSHTDLDDRVLADISLIKK